MDLLTWERPIDLGIDLHSSWEDMIVECTNVLPCKLNFYRLYNGNGFDELGIGYCILSK